MNNSNPLQTSRRDWILNWTQGAAGIGLAMMLEREGILPHATAQESRLHHPAKAKRVVQFFMSGAASQCDTFDYKPRLIRDHGQAWDPGEKVELFQSTQIGRAHV